MALKFKWLFWLALLVPCWGIALRYDIDLPTLYNAVRNASAGLFGAVYADLGSSIELSGATRALGRFFYPPFALVFFSPLGFLPYSVAKILWIVVQTVAFLWAWRSLERIFPSLSPSGDRWVWILAWIVAINPVHNNFQSNNIQLILAALLFGAEWLARKESPSARVWAGVLAVIPAGLKVYPLFLLPYFWLTKSRQTRIGILIGLALVIFLPYLVYGTDHARELYAQFFENVRTYGRENRSEDLLSLSALLENYFGPALGERGVSILNRVTFVGLACGLYLLAVWARLRLPSLRGKEAFSSYLFALSLSVMVLITPSTRPHYLIFLVPAFVAASELMQTGQRRRAVGWLAVAFVAIALTAEGVVGHSLNQWMERWKIPVWGILALTLTVALSLIAYIKGSAEPKLA